MARDRTVQEAIESALHALGVSNSGDAAECALHAMQDYEGSWTRSAAELNVKLTASERQSNELHERCEAYKYHIGEVMGCVREYAEMPCDSLLARLNGAVARANAATGGY